MGCWGKHVLLRGNRRPCGEPMWLKRVPCLSVKMPLSKERVYLNPDSHSEGKFLVCDFILSEVSGS